MKKRGLVLGVIFLGLIAAGGGVFAFMSNTSGKHDKKATEEVPTQLYVHNETGLGFSYPKSKLEQADINEKDKKENIFFRGQQESTDAQPFLVTARYETNLRQVAAISKMATIDIVRSGAEKSLPARFPEYKETENYKFKKDDHEAVAIAYTYKGPSGEVIKQKLYMLAKDDNTVIYLTVQARQTDFSGLEENIFKPILDSAKFE